MSRKTEEQHFPEPPFLPPCIEAGEQGFIDPKNMSPEHFRKQHMEDIGFVTRLIHDYIEREMNNQLRADDLTMSQSKILMFLRSRFGRRTTQKEIEDFLGVSHPTTVGLLKRLETKGYIRTETDSEDRRMKLVFLLEKDQELGRRMYECQRRIEAFLIEGLSEEEVQELKRLMGKVRDNVFRELGK